MSDQVKKIVSISLFFLIAISLRYYIIKVRPDFFVSSNLYIKVLLQGIGPMIGGLVVVYLLKRANKLTFFSIGIWRTLLVVVTPLFLFSLASIISTGQFSLYLISYVGVIMCYALLEEYGWRGYLQSELSGVKNIYKYLIIAILWFVWHLNFEISMGNIIFFIILFAGSYGIGFIAERSNSLIMCALFHSFFNLSQNKLLQDIDLTYKLGVIILSVLVAVLVMRNYRINNKKSLEIVNLKST
ncbi:hypothetical protein GCM10022393_25300 [Aquimarina addita]|uniref:CAAX prenyl protease 2/Lysostaphin resistance protein A-like domain-containing protein n=1 Tax=Aquimarina addita TaxID=870485 RepID=A0ABP6UNL1_9FLAO